MTESTDPNIPNAPESGTEPVVPGPPKYTYFTDDFQEYVEDANGNRIDDLSVAGSEPEPAPEPVKYPKYTKYKDNKIEFDGIDYDNFHELSNAHPDITFHKKPTIIATTKEIKSIADAYNVKYSDVVAKDTVVFSKLKESIDHPLAIESKRWVLLVGSSGTGKTCIALDYAKSRKKTKYIIQQGTQQLTVDDLLGYKSITTGEYFESLLRTAVEKGHTYIFDEIDGCNPNTLLALNALKHDYFQFPDKLVKVHKDFRFIATANTLEYDEAYLARTPMDKATISRFKVIEYEMEKFELAVRYGLDYIKRIDDNSDINFDELAPREIESMVIDLKIADEKESTK